MRAQATAGERRWRLYLTLVFALLVAACASPRPHKVTMGADDIDCKVGSSLIPNNAQCFDRTPEVSTVPPYRLHFVEFDDQGWLYPGRDDNGYVPDMGTAHDQLENAIRDVASRLQNERVLLLVYVHGWKHTAAHDDRDVKRFRQMLSDAAVFDARHLNRTVVGIYVGWRGASQLSASNPLINLTFWTRKNAAMHVSEGAPRELFARIRALREHFNVVDPREPGPKLRTVVIGHSFGGWVVFSALSPSILELLAQRADVGGSAKDWQQGRLRSVADMVILVNPAFEATRYEPIHSLVQNLAQKQKLKEYEPPVLLIVTSKADDATRMAFPSGRFLNTLFQRPFVSDDEAYAAIRTPGFVERYVTHNLSRDGADAPRGEGIDPPKCQGWRAAPADPGTENEKARLSRMQNNGILEKQRHVEWQRDLKGNNNKLQAKWTRQYCGGTSIVHENYSPHSPVWNVVTDGSVINDHNDIMGEPLHAFFRQLYLELPDPGLADTQARPKSIDSTDP